jgi:predicted  nucleic acid-binding Zn-ribbon protein
MDLTEKELKEQYVGALDKIAEMARRLERAETREADDDRQIAILRGMVDRRNERIAKLERQVARTKELYESSLAIVRRYQEKEG